MPDRDLAKRVVVITGASSGFGKGAARQFARRGAWLVLAARRDELLEGLANECRSLGIAESMFGSMSPAWAHRAASKTFLSRITFKSFRPTY